MGKIKAFLDKLFKPKNEEEELSPELRAKLDMLFAKIDEKFPPVETVRLKPVHDKTTVFDSKMGGVPYFPKEMEYPTVREGDDKGKPLYFLAQLNFGELPHIKGFPEKGILQFFIGCDNEDLSYGLNFKDLCDQNAFRVIFHENVVTDENALYSKSDMPELDNRGHLPFNGEIRLAAEKSERMTITNGDYRYEDAVLAAYNETFGMNLERIYGDDCKMCCNPDDIELFDAILEARCTIGTRMGGYPYFVGDAPCYVFPDLAGHTVLLFQSASEDIEGDYDYIDWGNHGGTANFLITPENLAKRDFSRVLYTWDIG